MLKPDKVHTAQLIALADELSPQERHHWHELAQPDRQRTYLLGRVLLRRLLAERLQCPAETLAFRSGAHGKPELCSHSWQFNLSHSGEWLVLALCQAGPLGVDIEMGQRRRPLLPLARRFYARSEYEWLAALPEPEQAPAFYRLWSRKEAVLKAHGGGIAAGLDKVRFVPEEGWRLDNRLDDQSYQVQDWSLDGGWLSLAAPTCRVEGYLLDERLKSSAPGPTLIHSICQESAS